VPSSRSNLARSSSDDREKGVKTGWSRGGALAPAVPRRGGGRSGRPEESLSGPRHGAGQQQKLQQQQLRGERRGAPPIGVGSYARSLRLQSRRREESFAQGPASRRQQAPGQAGIAVRTSGRQRHHVRGWKALSVTTVPPSCHSGLHFRIRAVEAPRSGLEGAERDHGAAPRATVAVSNSGSRATDPTSGAGRR